MTYTQQELLNIAALVNNDIYQSTSSIVISNIILVEGSTVRNIVSGFKASLYYDTATEKYIVDFCGTNDLMDWVTNLQAANGDIPDQFGEALDYIQGLTDAQGNPISASQIELITGHSIGGTLAQLIGEISTYSGIDVVTLNAYGSINMQTALSTFLAAQNPPLTLASSHSNITNYVVMNCEVGNLETQVGSTYYIQPVPLSTDPLHDGPLKDAHNSILLYTEVTMGEYYSSNELGFTNVEGLSLWYYDANNLLTSPLAEEIAGFASVESLQNALKIIKEKIGTPLHDLK